MDLKFKREDFVLRNKLEFYISFFEQLALKGFQAYASYGNEHISDICVNGYNIAYFTKSSSIEPNPFAHVEKSTIDALREILINTALTFGQNYFTPDDLSMIHANLVKARIMGDNDLTSNETADFGALISKIEAISPELGDIRAAVDFQYNAEFAEGGVEP